MREKEGGREGEGGGEREGERERESTSALCATRPEEDRYGKYVVTYR